MIATLLGAATLASCGSGPAPGTALAHLHSDEQYLPGRPALVFLPDGAPRSAPVVVLIPGGGWRTSDDTGLRPLAERLAANGMVAVTARYRAREQGVGYPAPVQDVVCAVSYAADRARRAGVQASALVVVGHSAGAHLAALAALVPERFARHCPYPAATATALVGLAGPYDIAGFPDIASALLAEPPAEAPAAWRAANPMTWAGERAQVPALLVHGTLDQLVPASATRSFAAALRAGGHRVRTRMVPGAGHAEVYRAGVAGPLIEAWVRGLPD